MLNTSVEYFYGGDYFMCRYGNNGYGDNETANNEYGRKLKYLVGIIIITLAVYVSFKYLLVYVWPFVLGVLVALIVEKPVNSISGWIYKGVRKNKDRTRKDKDETRKDKGGIEGSDNSGRNNDINKCPGDRNHYSKNNINQNDKSRNNAYKNGMYQNNARSYNEHKSNDKKNKKHPEHRIKSIIATIIMSVITIIIVVLLILAVITGANEVSSFLKNWDYNTIGIRQQTARICLQTDEFLGLEGGCCLDTLIMCGRKVAGIMPEKIFHISVPVIKNVVIVAGGLVVGFISVIYLSADMNEVRLQVRKSVFVEEIYMLWGEVKRLINIYFKVELRIMLINSLISMAAFFIIRSPYAVVLGIIVGIVDALPVFGTGTILIPWAVFSVIMRNYWAAGVLLVAYVITYFVREIMESKCIGDRLGISPFAMLVIIFVGLLAYGIPGFITGPVSYVIIKALVGRLRDIMWHRK